MADSSESTPLAASAAATPAVTATAVQSVEARGASAGAALLTRSLLGPDAWTAAAPAPAGGAAGAGVRARTGSNARSSFSGADGGVPLAPPSPSSSSGRRSRRGSASLSRTGGDDGELEEPQPRNMDELNDMLQELHRNQLWFIYVFASAREQFQNGAQQQADSVQKTLDDLALAVETVKSTQKRMLDIQRRTEAVKATVTGWRQKQITEAELAAAIKEAKLVQAQVAANVAR